MSSYEEFRIRIAHAIDREELEDIRQMMLEESGLTYSEKDKLSRHIEKAYAQAEELRQSPSRGQ